jgi:phage shock protein A
MNGITALAAREVSLEDRVAELEARVEKLEDAVMFLLENDDDEVPFESEDEETACVGE